MKRYTLLDAADVQPALRARAEGALLTAARELRIPVPQLDFVAPDPDGPIERERACDGWAIDSDLIAVSADVPLAEIEAVVAHETRHCWQRISGRFDAPLAAEDDAERYAWLKTGRTARRPHWAVRAGA